MSRTPVLKIHLSFAYQMSHPYLVRKVQVRGPTTRHLSAFPPQPPAPQDEEFYTQEIFAHYFPGRKNGRQLTTYPQRPWGKHILLPVQLPTWPGRCTVSLQVTSLPIAGLWWLKASVTRRDKQRQLARETPD